MKPITIKISMIIVFAIAGQARCHIPDLKLGICMMVNFRQIILTAALSFYGPALLSFS
jgi:hypothetical protein